MRPPRGFPSKAQARAQPHLPAEQVVGALPAPRERSTGRAAGSAKTAATAPTAKVARAAAEKRRAGEGARTTTAARLSSTELARRLAEVLPDLAAPQAQPLAAMARRPLAALTAALAAADPLARAQAAREIAVGGAPGAPEAMRALRERLRDEDPAVRAAAAIALIRLGDTALLDEMLKSLADPSPRVAAAAATALGVAGNQAAVPHLVAAFKTHDLKLGAAVASALAAFPDPRTVAPLLAALRADFVPGPVCLALGRLGDLAALPPLVRAIAHREAKVRAAAARALGLMREAVGGASCPAQRRGRALAALHKALDDPDRKVRLSAALALVELGDAGAGLTLVQMLDSPSPARPRPPVRAARPKPPRRR